MVAIFIALFSQFTGINTIIYYGSLVFLEHVPHQNATAALLVNVIVGAINCIATILGMSLIDRVGRKPLLERHPFRQEAPSGPVATSLRIAAGAR